ncbi:carbohydrate ABC transporter permease [Clostridium formicaceticum]|uniref:ABC transporter permease n=1 Tax=Clostridium formicaceticum TaxID=1497 RepID=A0AAC9RPS0_9CLOT|nr:carbohydrate ABC transporter permease [Clostridium formicaceticum]AOY77517.1 ABC transporter permease [Clostridium formicaceticum]ARE88085.1 L-arabinose transport system permease protein AraQ [Clostridium formicaceticum]
MRLGKRWIQGIHICLLWTGAILVIMPFLWMLSTSLKAPYEVLQVPIRLLPEKLQWGNYVTVFQATPLLRYFLNSLVITTLGTIGTLLTTILAAFAFSKLNFLGRDILFSFLVATMIVPSEILLIPNFVTLSQLGWIDSYKALIVPYLASVFFVFLLRQCFLDIPKELHLTAKVDGCSDFKFLWYIMVPIASPAIATIGLLKIINSWNSFMWPLIVTNSQSMRTLPVALTYFQTEAGTSYHLLMAATTMILVPIFLSYLFLQKYIIEGIARGGTKG